jgi:hypothetical protein
MSRRGARPGPLAGQKGPEPNGNGAPLGAGRFSYLDRGAFPRPRPDGLPVVLGQFPPC